MNWRKRFLEMLNNIAQHTNRNILNKVILGLLIVLLMLLILCIVIAFVFNDAFYLIFGLAGIVATIYMFKFYKNTIL